MPAVSLDDKSMLHREALKADPCYWTDVSKQGMVATAHYKATLAGAEILAKGGNAVDAVVACSLALGVCEPSESGLGGMAMMLLHSADENKTVVIDGACRAPALATPEAVAELPSRYRGYTAIAIPACPAVLNHALRSYGRLSLEQVSAPAIAVAEEGFPITSFQYEMARNHRFNLARENAGTLYLDARGEPWPVGHRMRNPALAETLRRLAKHGLEDFYRGGIAAQIAQDMETNGGFIRKADLEGFPAPRELPPRQGRFSGKEVVSIGPPGGGLTLLHVLNIYDKVSAESRRFEKPEDYILLANIIRLARRDRKRFQKETPMRSEGRAYDFLTDDYAERALSEITQPESSTESDTSHISVMDRWGNAVALTQSIDRVFGAKVLHPELGFLYNSYLKAFKIKAKSHSHFLRPGSLARSNAAPTLVFKDGVPCAALGSTGSERIVSGLLQVLLRLEHQSPFESIHAPRLHCTPDSEVLLEIERFPSTVPPAAVSSGFRLRPVAAYSYLMGGVQLVQRKDGEFLGVSDPRRDSAAAGPERVLSG